MTEQLKVLALAAAVIDHNENRGWYEEDMLLQDGVYYTKNARFIAAASPDVVLTLIAENEQLGHLYRKNENDWQNRFDEMKSERDALLDSRRADEALMREALKAINCTTLKCSDFHHKKADQHHHSDVCKPMIQYEIVLDKLRARLGGV